MELLLDDDNAFEEEVEDDDSIFEVDEDAFENIMQQRKAIDEEILLDAVDRESELIDGVDAIVMDKNTNLEQTTIDESGAVHL